MSKTLASKLAEVMSIVAYVQKDGSNDFHKYKYASAEKVYQKVNAELSARSIAVSSNCELLANTDDLSKIVAKVTLTLVDGDSGEQLSISGIGEGADKGDKAAMKAITAATKYALSTGFLISWGDDPEADSNTDRAASKPKTNVSESLAKQADKVTDLASLEKWKENVKKNLPALSSDDKVKMKELKLEVERRLEETK